MDSKRFSIASGIIMAMLYALILVIVWMTGLGNIPLIAGSITIAMLVLCAWLEYKTTYS